MLGYMKWHLYLLVDELTLLTNQQSANWRFIIRMTNWRLTNQRSVNNADIHLANEDYRKTEKVEILSFVLKAPKICHGSLKSPTTMTRVIVSQQHQNKMVEYTFHWKYIWSKLPKLFIEGDFSKTFLEFFIHFHTLVILHLYRKS